MCNISVPQELTGPGEPDVNKTLPRTWLLALKNLQDLNELFFNQYKLEKILFCKYRTVHSRRGVRIAINTLIPDIYREFTFLPLTKFVTHC